LEFTGTDLCGSRIDTLTKSVSTFRSHDENAAIAKIKIANFFTAYVQFPLLAYRHSLMKAGIFCRSENRTIIDTLIDFK
jgi:hypothetical protein